MAQVNRSNRAVTPPKGRPTRARHASSGRSRLFGPTAQWIAVVLALLIVFVIAVMLLDGGDFNPFNDESVQGAPGGTGTAPMSQPVNTATF